MFSIHPSLFLVPDNERQKAPSQGNGGRRNQGEHYAASIPIPFAWKIRIALTSS
jgi:hypothetical protein